jgi:hypothetical protein
MDVSPELWGEVSRAAAVVGLSAEEFAVAELGRAARAAVAPVSIYVLHDPRTGAPRYVGRSVNPAARMKAHRRAHDGSERAAWVAELAAEGLEPHMQVVCEASPAEADWVEQWWIDGLRADGFDLLNRQQVFPLAKVTISLTPSELEWIEEYRRARERPVSVALVVEQGVGALRREVAAEALASEVSDAAR